MAKKLRFCKPTFLHHLLSNELGIKGGCQCDQHYAVKWNPIKHVLTTSATNQATC